MKYLARISYDGSKFQGFQRLNNGLGVQNELERVLSLIANKEVLVHGAGRTDAGVHAYQQCIHFELDIDIELEKLRYVMNRMLSSYISVLVVSSVSDSFHARFSVKEKTYVYKIYFGEKNVFWEDYAYHVFEKLSVNEMREASLLFLGTHDFHNFVSGERDSYQSEITSIQIMEKDNFLLFEVKGQAFYRYMVRSIVGALLDVGMHKTKKENIEEALKNPSLSQRFSIAPAKGLYLTKITY